MIKTSAWSSSATSWGTVVRSTAATALGRLITRSSLEPLEVRDDIDVKAVHDVLLTGAAQQVVEGEDRHGQCVQSR